MIGFEDKKYPTVSVQGVILATNVLFLQKSPNIFVFLSIGIVLTLFTLQALNPRFFYYFPANSFAGKTTKHIDTFLLYALTFLAIFFMLAGIFNISLAIIGTLVITLSPFIWAYYCQPKIRESLTEKLSRETNTSYEMCPCCSELMVVKRKVLKWYRGIEYRKCLGKCGEEKVEIKNIKIG